MGAEEGTTMEVPTEVKVATNTANEGPNGGEKADPSLDLLRGRGSGNKTLGYGHGHDLLRVSLERSVRDL